jgi:F-type H+-transporting ATPase subunit epsilon
MAKSASIQVLVITPERQVLDAQTDSVVIPAHDGELGILRNRAPLMCELGVGQLRYQDADRTRKLMIDGGFAQIADNKVVVLTERAVSPDEVTSEMLAEADKRAAAAPGAKPAELTAHARNKRRAAVLHALKHN